MVDSKFSLKKKDSTKNFEKMKNKGVNFFNKISNTENISEFISNYIIDLYENKNIIFNPFCQSAICFAFDTRPWAKIIFGEIK